MNKSNSQISASTAKKTLFFLKLLSSFVGYLVCTHTFACSDEFKPVCGYWMHSPKTQTFLNECKMHEAGAKKRHQGSCTDKPSAAGNGSKQNAK